jgi:hypothetical protein
MTGITPEMTVNQHSCLSPSKIDQKCKAWKLFTHHFFCLLSFQTHGIASVARLQREEVSWRKQEYRETGRISTGFYQELASSVEFSQVFFWTCRSHGKFHKSTRNSASLKLMANATQIYFFLIDNGAPFPIDSGTHNTHISLSQWHFCLSCRCCPHSHHLFFIIEALVVDRQWHSSFR